MLNFIRKYSLAIVFCLYTFFVYREEFVTLGAFIVSFGKSPQTIEAESIEKSVAVLVFCAGIGLTNFLFALFFFSYYSLPIQTRNEHRKVFIRLLDFIVKRDGIAGHVQNGSLVLDHLAIKKPDERRGIFIVENDSAILFECPDGKPSA